MAGFYDVMPAPKESPLKRRRDELESMGTGERQEPPRSRDEPERGTDEYERRRERDYQRDLRENPRK